MRASGPASYPIIKEIAGAYMATKGKEALPVLKKAQDDPYEGVAIATSEGLRGEFVLPQAMELGGVG